MVWEGGERKLTPCPMVRMAGHSHWSGIIKSFKVRDPCNENVMVAMQAPGDDGVIPLSTRSMSHQL